MIQKICNYDVFTLYHNHMEMQENNGQIEITFAGCICKLSVIPKNGSDAA